MHSQCGKNRDADVAVVTVSCGQLPWYEVRGRTVAVQTIEITVNGKARAVATGATVATVLADLGLDRQRVAVERNADIVPRATYDDVVLQTGDTLEVVTFVGGG